MSTPKLWKFRNSLTPILFQRKTGRGDVAPSPEARDPRPDHGFTLVETLVVLVILAVAAALIIPNVTSGLSHARVKTAAKELASSMRYARTLAISQKVFVEVQVDLDKKSLTLSAETPQIPGFGNRITLGTDGKEGTSGPSSSAPPEKIEYLDQEDKKGGPITGGSQEMRHRQLPKEITLEYLQIDEEEPFSEGSIVVAFGPKGTSSGGTFFVSVEDMIYQIWVDPVAGRVLIDRTEKQ